LNGPKTRGKPVEASEPPPNKHRYETEEKRCCEKGSKGGGKNEVPGGKRKTSPGHNFKGGLKEGHVSGGGGGGMGWEVFGPPLLIGFLSF